MAGPVLELPVKVELNLVDAQWLYTKLYDEASKCIVTPTQYQLIRSLEEQLLGWADKGYYPNGERW